MAKLPDAKLKKLETYFSRRSDVAFAFLFGSYAKGTATKNSDVDIGVYFRPVGSGVEWEENALHPKENEVWNAVGVLLEEEVDIAVLNHVSVGLAYAVLMHGVPLAMNDQILYWRFYLLITDAALDFFSWTRDFLEIKERSQSLTPVDAERLKHASDFLRHELTAWKDFKTLTQQQYTDAAQVHLKRSVERWIENIVNASLDIAKTILASEKKQLPGKYKEMLTHLGGVTGFNADTANALGEFTKLRNILAHEYLDMRFAQIRKFLDEAEPIYRALADFTRDFLARAEQKI